MSVRLLTVLVFLHSHGPVRAGGASEVLLSSGDASPRPRQVIFLGRQINGHHNPSAFHAMMRLPWAERDLRMTFTVNLADLNAATLSGHDAIFIYGNAFYQVTAAQELAFRDYANTGGGVAAMHVACWSFPDAPVITSVIGGAFLGHHPIQQFSQVILPVEHPILKGLGTYSSVDEPYLFKNVAPDRTILTMREGPHAPEAMTWVRQQGQGRVFYHSGGHDSRTWVQPNFQELVTRGIEWVARDGDGPEVAGLGKARIGQGGAIAVRATLAGAEEKQVVLTRLGNRWHRPVLEGETVYELASGTHAPALDDPLRIGGAAALPVMAMVAGFNDAGDISRSGWWTGRGGLARSVAREGADLGWGSGFLTVTAVPVGIVPELVMNAGGTAVAQVFVDLEGAAELDTALLRASGGTPDVLLVEGEVLDDGEDTWTCGDLRDVRLSLNNGGLLAAVLPGADEGKVLATRTSGEWEFSLRTGASAPGLPAAGMVSDLKEVRLNDAGQAVAAVRLGADAALLRREAATPEWSLLLRDGSQPWLAPGESLLLPADGRGTLMDNGGTVWQLAGIGSGGPVAGCLIKIDPAGTAALVCREGGSLVLGDETVTLSALGSPNAWSSGPAGMAAGRMTVTPAAGLPRDVLVRWNGRQALPVLGVGSVFLSESGAFEVAAFQVDGGGTSEDGKGGFLTPDGQWVATASDSVGVDRLIQGADIADLDGDGRDDSLEVALGGDPAVSDSGTPLLGIEPVPAGSVLRFLRRTDAPFSYVVETSENLRDWLPSTGAPQPAAAQSGVPAGYQRMELPLSGDSRFARVRVSAD
jgi:type 1 glutamine amidotransferase